MKNIFIKNNNQSGFSIIEIVISISLLVLISSLIFFSFNSLNNKQSLDKQIDLIESYINKTRNNAINSLNNSDQTIIFSTTSITYLGQTIELDNKIKLYSYTTKSNNITFSRLTGFPNATGTLFYNLHLDDDIFATSSITINNLGIIE